MNSDPKQTKAENDILNAGLLMATEFGGNWLKPIQERLKEKYPSLKTKELDQYNQICQRVMKESNQFINQTLSKERIDSINLPKILEQFILKRYPWINAESLTKLHSQGCYYAWKDGLISGDI